MKEIVCVQIPHYFDEAWKREFHSLFKSRFKTTSWVSTMVCYFRNTDILVEMKTEEGLDHTEIERNTKRDIPGQS